MTSLFQLEPDFDEDDVRRSRRTRRLKRKLRGRSDGELNIVSMIDVFAVLVFFLLVGSSISASKLHAVNLTIPVASSKPAVVEDEFHLAVSIYNSKVVVSEASTLESFPHIDGEIDRKSLTALLRSIKAEHPDEDRVSLLVEDTVPYEQIIQVMDSIRMNPESSDTEGAEPLFPLISMGDIATKNDEAGGR